MKYDFPIANRVFRHSEGIVNTIEHMTFLVNREKNVSTLLNTNAQIHFVSETCALNVKNYFETYLTNWDMNAKSFARAKEEKPAAKSFGKPKNNTKKTQVFTKAV